MKKLSLVWKKYINRMSVLITVFSVFMAASFYNPASLAFSSDYSDYQYWYFRIYDGEELYSATIPGKKQGSVKSYSVNLVPVSHSVTPYAGSYAHSASYSVSIPCNILQMGLGNFTANGFFVFPFKVSSPNSVSMPFTVDSITPCFTSSALTWTVGDTSDYYYVSISCSDLPCYNAKLLYFTLNLSVSATWVSDSPVDNGSNVMTFSGVAPSAIESWMWNLHLKEGLPASTSTVLGNNVQSIKDGYDSSSGNVAQSKLNTSLSGQEAREDSLFTSAADNLSEFSLTDLSAMPKVVAGLSFVSSTMTSIFEALGGVNGAGIVLSVGCSILFVSFCIGAYKFYSGRKD